MVYDVTRGWLNSKSGQWKRRWDALKSGQEPDILNFQHATLRFFKFSLSNQEYRCQCFKIFIKNYNTHGVR
jgi:hypothetical protein